MINHVLPRMACVCVMLVLALAHCGCQSTGSSSWASAWKTKPPAPTNPNDKEVVTYLGQKKAKKSDPPDAEELQSRMEKTATSERTRLYNEQIRLAKQNLKDRRLDDAKRAYERALSVRPNDPDCHHGLAVIADDQKEFAVADKHYEAAMKQRPSDPNLLSDYGYSQSLRQNDKKAERILNDALNIAPKHEGALANLAAIYQRQGRRDDCLAMLRRSGASDGDVQQYMAQLFPPAGSEIAQAGAQNSDPRGAPPMPTDDRRDYSKMTKEELLDAMRRAREADVRKRNERDMAEMRPPQRDWDTDPSSSQGAYAGPPSGNQKWVLGPQNSNSQQSNQLPVVNPNGGTGQQQGGNPQYAMNQSQGGYVPQDGSLMAPRGTQPNLDAWSGAPPQSNYQQPQNNYQQPPAVSQGNMSPQGNMQQGNGNGWNQQQQGFAGDPAQNNPLGNRLNIAGLQPGLNSDAIAQSSFSNSQSGYGNGGSMAAAQLGMNLGPGGLFPVVNSDQPGNAAPSGSDSRFGYEFPQAPPYQDPNQSNRGSLSPPDLRQQGSMQNPNGAQLAPPSLNDDWGQSNSRNVTQAGGTMDGFSSGNSSSQNSRGSMGQWGDPSSSSRGSTPYSGAWPPIGQQPTQNMPSGTNSTNANYPPPWNRGGTGTTAPQSRGAGPSTTNGSGMSPDQWPYSKGQ